MDLQNFRQLMQTRIDSWSAKVNHLAARARREIAEGETALREDLESMLQKRETVRTKFDKLKQATEQGWERLKLDLDHAWDSLKLSATTLERKLRHKTKVGS